MAQTNGNGGGFGPEHTVEYHLGTLSTGLQGLSDELKEAKSLGVKGFFLILAFGSALAGGTYYFLSKDISYQGEISDVKLDGVESKMDGIESKIDSISAKIDANQSADKVGADEIGPPIGKALPPPIQHVSAEP